MHKYAKVLIVLLVIGVVFAIMFRPTGKLMTDKTDVDLLTAYEDAKNKEMPVLLEFYGDY